LKTVKTFFQVTIVALLFFFSPLFSVQVDGMPTKTKPEGEIEREDYDMEVTYLVDIMMDIPANFTIYSPMPVDNTGEVDYRIFNETNKSLKGNATYTIIDTQYGKALNITGHGNFTLNMTSYFYGEGDLAINLNNSDVSLWGEYGRNYNPWDNMWGNRTIWIYLNCTEPVYFTAGISYEFNLTTYYQNGEIWEESNSWGSGLENALYGDKSGEYYYYYPCFKENGWVTWYGMKGGFTYTSLNGGESNDSSFLPAFTTPLLILATSVVIFVRKRKAEK